ncbi:MAG: hypothetical protein AB1894_14865 [Chloroflexota bacterium]
MAPLEPWEKVLVDAEAFPQTVHGQIACTQCHGGQQNADKETAHTGVIARPSDDPKVCGMCHPQQAKQAPENLHFNQQGYWTVLTARGADANDPHMQEMFGNHCASCHTSCGDCHVSQPASVEGGFIEGHLFKKTPSMTRNCTACHGSRVGNEYLGKNEGVLADVHFRQARMKCTDCHNADAMHGMTAEGQPAPEHRYDGPQSPLCTDCHPQVGAQDDSNQMHTVHGDKLACQVCHSVSYSSCDGCHVAISEKTGKPFFATEGTYLSFAIGLNPRQDEYRPYEYVLLRHVPISPDSFSYYGDNLLPNFDASPTWVYATPHNIQRNTPQNESCEACHGHAELFLTEEKVAESELAANLAVIVQALPGQGGSGGGQGLAPALPANHAGTQYCVVCHIALSDPAYPASHTTYEDTLCTNCHAQPEP